MCLIVFAYNCHPDYQLILGANRDEYRDRLTDPAHYWSDCPHILAGRDLLAGGTWLGITDAGKLAAITNYRDPRQQVLDPPSRGRLASAFLQGRHDGIEEFQGVLNRDGNRYDGFSLLYGTAADLHYFTNRGGSSGPVYPGIHALSNHLLDSSWPKATVARNRLETIIGNPGVNPEQIFAALSDPTPFADNLLPDTGIGPERERLLSPLFIENESYGTRSTTVLLIDRCGGVTFMERSFDWRQKSAVTKQFNFNIQPPSR